VVTAVGVPDQRHHRGVPRSLEPARPPRPMAIAASGSSSSPRNA